MRSVWIRRAIITVVSVVVLAAIALPSNVGIVLFADEGYRAELGLGWVAVREASWEDGVMCPGLPSRLHGFPFAYYHVYCRDTDLNPLLLMVNALIGGAVIAGSHKLAKRYL